MATSSRNNSDKYRYCPNYDAFYANSKQRLYTRLKEHLNLREPLIKQAVQNTIDELKRRGYQASNTPNGELLPYNASFISIAAIQKLIDSWEGPVISNQYKRRFNDPRDETAEIGQAKFNKDAINWLDQSSYRVTGADFFAPHLGEIRQYLMRYAKSAETETISETDLINYGCIYFAVQLLSLKTRFKRSKQQPLIRHKTLVNSKELHSAFRHLYKYLDLARFKDCVKQRQKQDASKKTNKKKKSKGSLYRVNAAEFAENVLKLCQYYLAKEKQKLGIELDDNEMQHLNETPLYLQHLATDSSDDHDTTSSMVLHSDVDSDDHKKYEPSADVDYENHHESDNNNIDDDDSDTQMEANGYSNHSDNSNNSRQRIVSRLPPKPPRPPSPETASHTNSSAVSVSEHLCDRQTYDAFPPAPTTTEPKVPCPDGVHMHANANCACCFPAPAPPRGHNNQRVARHHEYQSLPPMVPAPEPVPLLDAKTERTRWVMVPFTQMVPIQVDVDEFERIISSQHVQFPMNAAYPPTLPPALRETYGYTASRGGRHNGYAREYRHAPYARYADDAPQAPRERLAAAVRPGSAVQPPPAELPPVIETSHVRMEEPASSGITNLFPMAGLLDDYSLTSSDAALSQPGGRILSNSSASEVFPSAINTDFAPY